MKRLFSNSLLSFSIVNYIVHLQRVISETDPAVSENADQVKVRHVVAAGSLWHPPPLAYF